MNVTEIQRELEPLRSESYKRIIFNHGVREPALGVKIGDLKRIQKRVKKDHALALELYDTGVYELQYLAGLIADESKMTKALLRKWLSAANCPALSSSMVAAVAAESSHGRELALEWMKSTDEQTAQTGWTTLGLLIALKSEDAVTEEEAKALLEQIARSIHKQPDHVRYAMNNLLIAVGIYYPQLTDAAIQTGKKIGPVSVDMGDTACKVPCAPDYIKKARDRGSIGKRRKSARC